MYPKISIFLLFYFITLSGYSQDNGREYKLYKHEISLGFVKPLKSTVGVSFTTEPKFSVIDNLAIGLRLEGSLWIDTDNERIQALDGDALFSYSIVPTADYYFSKNLFRPFVGVGYGLYFYPSSDMVYNGGSGSYTYKDDKSAGLMVRGGFEVGHFRLGVNYNRVQRKVTYGSTYYNNQFTEDWGYIDLKIGFIIGGKRNK